MKRTSLELSREIRANLPELTEDADARDEVGRLLGLGNKPNWPEVLAVLEVCALPSPEVVLLRLKARK